MKNILGLTLILVLALGSFTYSRKVSAFPNRILFGTASWYSERDRGIRPTTANREKFDDGKITAAMWGVPFGTLVKVTNTASGKFVVVRVNDRGPARRLVRKGRIIDLTKEAFSRIAPLRKGLVSVEITILSYT